MLQKQTVKKKFFIIENLNNSLRKAGANEDTIKYVIEEISKEGKDGISTEEIYRKAFSILRKKQRQQLLDIL
jgi:ribosomal protein S7